jgi:neutral amino acid transport system ATP-binding protein
MLVQLADITFGYAGDELFDGLTWQVNPGEHIGLVGPNGAGKSTLLKSIYGLVKPRSGSVIFRSGDDEHEITGWKPYRLTSVGLNYVPQLANVFPNMTVLENLEVGARVAGAQAAEQVERVVETFPLLHQRRRARAGTLSGGQRQMLALARALVTNPRVILLDEPSAGLAATVVDDLFERLAHINREGTAILLVEQNARRSLAMSDYGYVLDMGRNCFEGVGRALVDDPKIADLYLGGRGRLAAARAASLGEDPDQAPGR